MDGIIFFTIFSMGIALPVALGIFGIAAGVVFLACLAYCKHLQRSIEEGRREFREEFGYEMGESPLS